MCLQSIVEGGFKGKNYIQLRKEIIETYGLEQIKTFNTLERNGMLINRDAQAKGKPIFNWGNLRASMKLINTEYNKERPDSSCYAYTGYKPISVRLVEMALGGEWRGIAGDEQLKRIPGSRLIQDPPKDRDTNKRRVVMVYMIGGLAYSEISAMRMTAVLWDIELIICTTSIVNYKKLITAIAEPVY